MVAAAAPRIPPALVSALAMGGRLVIPVGRRQQELRLIRRLGPGAGGLVSEALVPVRFVPLVGAGGKAGEGPGEG